MSKVLVIYYSSFGHIETMAKAVAEGARGVSGTQVDVCRVAELVPDDIAERSGYKRDQDAPQLDDPNALVDYDAIIIGTPTRYGNMASQMRNFWDKTGGIWAQGKLVGKVGSAFTSTASQHGGQETTLTSIHTMLFHLGMVVVGVPYSCQALSELNEVSGGTPYGATTIAGGDASRQPSDNELTIARFQGQHVAELTSKLAS
ncbi:NAD(P)H dehydrogenase (quinone) [Modicisalibacter muralis]|uniref:NAD(P)H dehydrogenase (quinone) n=1 Tax=Modicisalibacter muralis TaxID=119000 RepID=A0A1G9EKD3_9GAMM|nr:NAD(P)H:quinone oxidoreductase [Halomonas muralis]SDK76620.1 NAD(P)H dehydrogenase (quinone) [Halomonas muralis]